MAQYEAQYMTDARTAGFTNLFRNGDEGEQEAAFKLHSVVRSLRPWFGCTAVVTAEVATKAANGYALGYYEVTQIAEASSNEKLAVDVDMYLADHEDETVQSQLSHLLSWTTRQMCFSSTGSSTSQASNMMDLNRVKALQELLTKVAGI